MNTIIHNIHAAKIRKFLKPSEEKIHFLFRGAETQMKSNLSKTAK